MAAPVIAALGRGIMAAGRGLGRFVGITARGGAKVVGKSIAGRAVPSASGRKIGTFARASRGIRKLAHMRRIKAIANARTKPAPPQKKDGVTVNIDTVIINRELTPEQMRMVQEKAQNQLAA